MSKQSAASAKGDDTQRTRIAERPKREQPHRKISFTTLAQDHRPASSSSSTELSETEEYEIRMDKIRSYLDGHRELSPRRRLTCCEAAALFVLPLDVLLAAQSWDLYVVCVYMPRMVKHYLKPFQAGDESPHVPLPAYHGLGDRVAAGTPPIPEVRGRQTQARPTAFKGEGKGKGPARPPPPPRATRGASAGQTASRPKGGGGAAPGPSIPRSKRQSWFEPPSLSSSSTFKGPPPPDQARSSRRRAVAPKDYHKRSAQGPGERDEKDGSACVLTGSRVAVEACRILPPTWTETKNEAAWSNVYVGISQVLNYYLGRQQHGDLIRLTARVGALDRAWNAIPLKASLRRCWGRAYVGLRYEGQTPSASLPGHVDVAMAFHWLGRNKVRPGAVADLDPGSPRWIDGLDDAFWCARARRLLRDGPGVTVAVPAGEVGGFVAAVDLQWACARIARLCGAGEAPGDLPSFRDLDDFLSPLW